MGQLRTDEMEKPWQAIQHEAANPKDPPIAHDIHMSDLLRGLAHDAAAVSRCRAVAAWGPLPLRQQVESANIDRQIEAERSRWYRAACDAATRSELAVIDARNVRGTAQRSPRCSCALALSRRSSLAAGHTARSRE